MPYASSISSSATQATRQRILRDVTEADYDHPTVCPDLAQLADHLIGTVTSLGAAAGNGAGATPGPGPLETRAAAHRIIGPDIGAAASIH